MIQLKFSYWNSSYKNVVFSNIAKAKKLETSLDDKDQAKKVESNPKAMNVTQLVPAKTKQLKIKNQVEP